MTATSIKPSDAPRRVGSWAFLLGSTMPVAMMTYLFVLNTSPAPAIVLRVLDVLIAHLRRQGLVEFVRSIAKCD